MMAKNECNSYMIFLLVFLNLATKFCNFIHQVSHKRLHGRCGFGKMLLIEHDSEHLSVGSHIGSVGG